MSGSRHTCDFCQILVAFRLLPASLEVKAVHVPTEYSPSVSGLVKQIYEGSDVGA